MNSCWSWALVVTFIWALLGLDQLEIDLFFILDTMLSKELSSINFNSSKIEKSACLGIVSDQSFPQDCGQLTLVTRAAHHHGVGTCHPMDIPKNTILRWSLQVGKYGWLHTNGYSTNWNFRVPQ